MSKSISLLLGAGFSVPQGYPTSKQLNNLLLNCTVDDFSVAPNGNICKKDNTSLRYSFEHDRNLAFCIDLIHYYHDKYCDNNNSKFDYEEFYDYYRNEAKNDIGLIDFFKAKRYNGENIACFKDYLFQVNSLFNQIVSFYLNDKNGKSRYDNMPFLLKSTTSPYANFLYCIEYLSQNHIINIHTLNHDLFFERLNNTEWINGKICDGFEEQGSPYYGKITHKNKEYKVRLEKYTGNYDKKIRLYKLHGSKDYYKYSTQEGLVFTPEAYIKGICGCDANFYKEKKDENGKLFYENCWINYHSDFLTGTTSKIIRYNEPLLYKKLFDLFIQNLKDAEMLIIIGYGCKDSEINKIIFEKFNKNKPCYIINPYADNTVKNFIQKIGNHDAKLISKSIELLDIKDFGFVDQTTTFIKGNDDILLD